MTPGDKVLLSCSRRNGKGLIPAVVAAVEFDRILIRMNTRDGGRVERWVPRHVLRPMPR